MKLITSFFIYMIVVGILIGMSANACYKKTGVPIETFEKYYKVLLWPIGIGIAFEVKKEYLNLNLCRNFYYLENK